MVKELAVLVVTYNCYRVSSGELCGATDVEQLTSQTIAVAETFCRFYVWDEFVTFQDTLKNQETVFVA